MKKENRSYKVIVDSNIWISFLIGKSLKGFQNHIDSHKIKIITCNEQLHELSDVLSRPKLKKYFTKLQVIEFFDLLDFCSDNITITSITNLCRDAKDDYLVSLSIDSQADFLITGDMDLLVLNKIGKTLILKYTDFETVMKVQI